MPTAIGFATSPVAKAVGRQATLSDSGASHGAFAATSGSLRRSCMLSFGRVTQATPGYLLPLVSFNASLQARPGGRSLHAFRKSRASGGYREIWRMGTIIWGSFLHLRQHSALADPT